MAELAEKLKIHTNQIAELGGFIRSGDISGTRGIAEQLADIDLASGPFYSRFTDHIAGTEATRARPDMQGSGMVRNLRDAASRPISRRGRKPTDLSLNAATMKIYSRWNGDYLLAKRRASKNETRRMAA